MRRTIILFILFLSIFTVSILSMFMVNNTDVKYIDENVKSSSTALPIIEYEWMKVKSGMDGAKLEIDSQDNIIFLTSQPYLINNESVIMKYTSNGVLLWEKTWNYWNETRSHHYVVDLALDSFDNIYLTGTFNIYHRDIWYSEEQIFVRKYNSEGILQWHIEIGDEDEVRVNSIRFDKSGDVILSGYVSIRYTDDKYLMILKLGSLTGNQIWSKIWAMNQYTYSKAMELDSNDDIYILCNFYGINNDYILKFDQNGNYLWNVSIDDTGRGLFDIGIDNDDNLYILAPTNIFLGGSYLGQLIKYNSTGSKLWVNFPVAHSKCIYIDYNNNIYLPGSLTKLDRFGNKLWNLTHTGEFYYEKVRDIAVDSSGYLYFGGTGWDFRENPSCFLVKHDNTAEPLIAPKFDKRNLYALLIGIENYPGTENDLIFCIEDARSINWYLSGECDITGDTITRLYNSLGTNNRINAELEYIKSVITPEDGFFMYFSGHGTSRAFCSYDTFEYLYSDLDLHFDEMNCSNKILLIDTCDSGSLVQDFSGEDVYVMASCLEGEISTESFQFIGGVFTNYFDKSPKYSYDTNSDGALSLEEQYPYILSQVSSYAEQYSYSQHPVQLDNNEGPTILYPGIRGVTFKRTENRIYYDFDVDGYGQIYYCNLTAIYHNKYQVYDLTNSTITRTGFGHYTGFIEMAPDLDVSLELEVGIKGQVYRKFIYTETLKIELISFGHFYLIFMFLSLISISIILKKKYLNKIN